MNVAPVLHPRLQGKFARIDVAPLDRNVVMEYAKRNAVLQPKFAKINVAPLEKNVVMDTAKRIAVLQAKFARINVAHLEKNVVMDTAKRIAVLQANFARINVANPQKNVVMDTANQVAVLMRHLARINVARMDINVVMDNAKSIVVETYARAVLKNAVDLRGTFERRIGFCEMAAHGARIIYIAITTPTVYLARSALFILATAEMFASKSVYYGYNILDQLNLFIVVTWLMQLSSFHRCRLVCAPVVFSSLSLG